MRAIVPASPLAAILAVVLACAACCGTSFAAHPLQTEDTGTQGAGNVEIENGFARARAGGTTLSAWQPQVSLGLAPTLDAILQPSLAWLRDDQAVSSHGPGDTNVDAKWRFWGADPWSLAIRAGVQAPTSAQGLGLQHGEISEHALLVATWDGAPTTVHANLGLTHLPPAPGTRQNVAHASAAVMQALAERMILSIDGELGQDPAATRRTWPGSVLAGVIWTARPGLDLDVGYQASVRAQAFNRQWMAGITYRFAL